MNDHYLVSCDGERCEPLFRAVQVRSRGRCGRVTNIEAFPQWAEAPIRTLIDGTRLPASSRVVVSVEYLFGYPRVADRAKDLSDSLDEPRVVLHPETPAVVRAWYQNRGAAERHRIRKGLVIEIGLYAGVIVLLAGSTGWLIRALWWTAERRQTRMLMGPLGLKASLAVLVVWVCLLQGSDSGGPPTPLLLAVPGAVIFMLADLVLFCSSGWLRRPS